MKDCNQCGKCCVKYAGGGLSATAEEIDMWKIFQPSIYQYVRNGKIWMHPETGEQLSRCPFVGRFPDQLIRLRKKNTPVEFITAAQKTVGITSPVLPRW
jgi:hypothetical protein